jgi:hypothetical protein
MIGGRGPQLLEHRGCDGSHRRLMLSEPDVVVDRDPGRGYRVPLVVVAQKGAEFAFAIDEHEIGGRMNDDLGVASRHGGIGDDDVAFLASPD